MPPKAVIIDKAVGETPLAAIARWKESHPEHAHVRATYAGRLDPMATGKLLVLLGDECKKRELYQGLDKEYHVEVLLDVGSDTGDILGLTTLSLRETRLTKAFAQHVVNRERGTHEHPYPAFSSKPVDGTPLFQYALEGRTSEIEIPTHSETIHRIHVTNVQLIGSRALHERIDHLLAQVPRTNEPTKWLGENFRIERVELGWQRLFTQAKDRRFAIITLSVTCGSGTYMRTLAERIGTHLGTNALALSIHRSKIGRFFSLGPFSFWTKTYR